MKGFGSIFLGIIGIVMFLFSFVLLWQNEGNNAEKISIAKYAAKNAVQISASNIDRKNDNKLIAVSSPANTNDTISDSIIRIPNTLVLERNVQMYQWSEDKSGEKTVYNKVWSEDYIESENFENKIYVNPKFPLKSKAYYAQSAKLGDFSLTKKQIENISAENEYSDLQENSKFSINNGTYFSGKDINNPQIGDIIISYNYSPSKTEIAIIGKQNSNNTITSLPYKKTNIYIQYNGNLTKEEIIEEYRNENSFMTMLIRLGGWLLMFLGLKFTISPVLSLLNFIPIVGKLTDFLTSVVLGVISFVLSLVTISIAWFAYRPVISILLILFSVLCLFLVKRFTGEKIKANDVQLNA